MARRVLNLFEITQQITQSRNQRADIGANCEETDPALLITKRKVAIRRHDP